MSGSVNSAVLQAIQAGQTNITRRAVITESDGTTLWNPGITPRVKAGNVDVDYTRSERRTLDITLDNTDRLIDHNPDGGFWYDKVIKVYRGINYPNLKRKPSVAILNTANSNLAVSMALTRAGFSDLTFYSDATLVNQDALLNFDIIVGWAVDANLSVATATLLAQAYAVGKSILTMCNFADATTVPLISATVARVSASAWDVSPVTNADTPFINQLVQYNASNTSGETVPSALRASARIAATTSFSGTKIAAVYETNITGGKWFHYHPKINMSYTPIINTSRFLSFFTSAISWLYSYAAQSSWETQIGEFMIDKISSTNFPHEIKVSGRDYTKKILNTGFNNSVTFSSGTPLDTVIGALGGLSGINKLKLSSGGALLPSDFSFDPTSNLFDASKGMTDACNVELFVDAYGYLTTRQFLDPTLSPQTLFLYTGKPGGNLVSFTLSSDDSELYNRIVVSGESSSSAVSGILYQAISENHSPTSPTRIAISGLPGGINARTYRYTSPFFTSNAQCQAYADRLLSYHALESFNVDFASLVFPWLEAGEIIGYDAIGFSGSIPDRFLLTQFKIPLGLEPMTGSCKRITIVG